MILKASQRGNAGELAKHLLNEQENEHVEVHAVNGFMVDDLSAALQEVHAVSLGTKCQQPLFSVSLSPPKGESASIHDFEQAIVQIAEKTGLENQPHIIVFHEKNGRRHCHVVYSRINSETMTAINLPFYKNKLMEVSKELYLKHGWKLPQGHIDRKLRNPLNFTRGQWQQAKRLNEDPKQIKQTLKECWAISDSKKAFASALEQKGFYLAKGDRRGFVAIDWRGEIYSLSRWLDISSKALKDRLGEPKNLPSVDEIKANMDKILADKIHQFNQEIQLKYHRKYLVLQKNKERLVKQQRHTRNQLNEKQNKRQQQENKKRQNRFSKGFRGLWDRLTGNRATLKKQNKMESYQSMLRDRAEKDSLIQKHLNERSPLQNKLDDLNAEQQKEITTLKDTMLTQLPEEKTVLLQQVFNQSPQKTDRNFGLSL